MVIPRQKLLFILLILSLTSTISGIDHTFYFRNITNNDGLSENHINCIYQDKSGFIWIGTNGGLNRYDGYEFKLYHFDPYSETGLKSNIIQCITEDQNNNLWLGTADRGVFKMNMETEEFTYFENTPDQPDKYLITHSFQVISDTENRIWFRGKEGIEIFFSSENNSSIHSYKIPFHEGSDSGQLKSNPTNLFTDQSGRVWIGSEEGLYLAMTDSLDKKHIYLKHLPEITRQSISDIDTVGKELLLAGSDGLLRVKVDNSGKIISTKKVCANIFETIEIDNSGNLWGCGKDGLKYYTFCNDLDQYIHAKSFRANTNSANSISEDYITTIEQDNTGILWFGTNSKGLCILDPERKEFQYHSTFSRNHNPSLNKVRGLYQDSKNNIWIGAAGGYIFLAPDFPERNFSDHIITEVLKVDGENADVVYSFAEGLINNQPHIWVGAGNPFNLGVIPLTDHMSKGYTVESIKGFPHAVYYIIVDSDNIVWACTYDNGLYKLFPNEKGLDYWENIKSNQDGSGLSSNIIRSVFEDNEGNILVGTSNGLDLIRKSEKLESNPEIIHFRHDPNDLNSISHNYILPIIQDSDNVLWIGTMGGGVNKITKDQKGDFHFTHINMNNGLPDNMIKGLLEDNSGNIWISSNRGLSRYYNKRESQQYTIGTGEITNFGINDGLQDLEFSDLSSLKTEKGELFFGGISGLNSFYPDSIQIYQGKAIPVFTELQVLNKIIKVNEKLNGRILLNKIISSTPEITLNSKENSFSIKFSAIHFASPQNNKFKFILEGFDTDWVNTDGINRIARYTNIKPGHYTFKLKASNNDFVWNPEPVTLDIIVNPPYWRTKLAFVLYFIIFILSFFFFRKFTIISIQKKRDLFLEQLREKHLEEIARIKLNIFTMISHEVRTPLTLIKGPVKKLMSNFNSLSDEKRLKLYHSIDKNASLINSLINQILDFRKAEQGKIELSVTHNDIVEFIKKIFDNFLEWSSEKNIILKFHSEQNHLFGWFDPDVLEKILDNLITNAIKYTPDKGEVKLIIKIENNDRIVVFIKDTGIGIPKEKIEHIFELFYKTDQSYNSNSTGIGLSFVKTLTKLHHGDICCTSKPDSGTTFTLTLPINRKAFSENELSGKPLLPNDIQKKITVHDESSTIQHPPVQRSKGDEVKLLVIDDNKEILEFIADNVPANFRVFFAENGEEGVTQALRKNPDIIVCDIMMPVMDGIEFCSTLKNHPDLCHIPILLLTAKGEDKDRIEGFSTGADAYIIKPFDIDVLISHIDAIYKNRQILRKIFSSQIDINPSEITVTNRDEILLKKIISIMEENISNPKFTTRELSKMAGKSINQLNIKLKAITGHTTGSLIKAFRLKRAAQLFEKSDYTISEITFNVGFNDLKYFRACFKKEFGLSPSQYRLNKLSERKQPAETASAED